MLDSKQIIDAAKNQTNLEYFGNPLFLEGFECLVQSINQEADLNDIGMEAQQHRLIGILANLLRIEDACMQHPEILNEEIKSPVVIVGLPRTGSTMTHRLHLTQDTLLCFGGKEDIQQCLQMRFAVIQMKEWRWEKLRLRLSCKPPPRL